MTASHTIRMVAASALAIGVACPAMAQDDGPVEIAFVSFTQDITDMYGQVLRGLQARLDAEGVAYEMTTAAPPSPEDFAGMDRILADVATMAPDYAVIGGASYELIDDRIAQIEATGTTTIVVDVLPTALTFEPAAAPLTWVAVDHALMGRVGGEYMAEQYCAGDDDEITVALFWGPAASEISQNRVGGAMEMLEAGLAECGKSIEVVEEVFADFNRERAFNLMTNMSASSQRIDLVIGANSNTALGIMDALESQGLLEQGPDILGMGGQLDELAAICRGDITAAGFRDARLMGTATGDAILNHRAGSEGDVPEVTVAEIPILHDCEGVFEVVPPEMLELTQFRSAIPAEMWDQFNQN